MSAATTHPENVYIGLGSNLGDRAGNLLLAVRSMMEAGLEIIRLSSVYETAPFETFAQPAFLNMVAELNGNGLTSSDQLMAILLKIELELGRTREVERGPRSIDLDLLMHGNRVQSTAILTLPHPRFHERRFVLAPLAELCPQLVHPVLQMTIRQLLATTTDHSEVRLWQPPITNMKPALHPEPK